MNGVEPVWDELDERMLRGMREVWTVADPPPDFLVDQVRLTLGLVDIDTEVLRIIELGEPVGVRGDEQTRRITFGGDDLTVMISVVADADGTVRLDGWLAPAAVFEIEVQATGGQLTTTSDDQGRFALTRVPRGLARMVLRSAGQRSTVTTPTVEL